ASTGTRCCSYIGLKTIRFMPTVCGTSWPGWKNARTSFAPARLPPVRFWLVLTNWELLPLLKESGRLLQARLWKYSPLLWRAQNYMPRFAPHRAFHLLMLFILHAQRKRALIYLSQMTRLWPAR